MNQMKEPNSVICHRLLVDALDKMIVDKIEDGFPQALVDFVATIQSLPVYKNVLDAETIKWIGKSV